MRCRLLVVLLSLVLGMSFIVAMAPAEATPLDTLINNNGSISVGDLTFSNFSASFSPSGNAGLISASGINVAPSGNGLQFTGINSTYFNFAAPTSGCSLFFCFSDSASNTINLGYTVSDVNPSTLIGGFQTGAAGSIGFFGPGSGSIQETIMSNNVQVGGVAFGLPFGSSPPLNLPSESTLIVTTQLYVAASGFAGHNGFAGTSSLTETYSESLAPIPEPSTLALLAAGIVGLVPMLRGLRQVKERS